MCCCGKPTINGQPGYRWQPTDPPTIRQPHAPKLEDRDELIYDEPGRCGGLDGHCHHFRLVKSGSTLYLLVHHGGGDERIRLGCVFDVFAPNMAALDSTGRYWLLYSLYSVHSEAAKYARGAEAGKWMQAAAGKRIKTRKARGYNSVRVWIEDPKTPDTVGFSSR